MSIMNYPNINSFQVTLSVLLIACRLFSRRQLGKTSTGRLARRESGGNPKKESTVRFHPLEATDSVPPDTCEEIAPISSGKLWPIINRSSRVPSTCLY
jgi:hypothetical protein